jgi:hypothetical protein
VRVRRFVHMMLFIVASILLWQTIGTWRRSLDGQRPVAQQNPSEEKPFPFALSPQLQVGKQYANTIADKDLFVPSRGRTQVEAKPAATVPPPSHLKLVGVVLNRGKEEALFADSSQGGKVVRVRKGEVLGSYKLVGLAPLQATLTIGQDGEEVSLPLLVIDSGTAGQAQRLMPPQVKGNAGRPAQVAGRQAPPPPPPPGRAAVPPPPASPQHQETRAIRQNIQQLQQRLRQIRRQAARGEGAEEENNGDEGGGDDEENEE